MNLHVSVSPDQRVKVRRAPGPHVPVQVTMEYFPGESPATSYSILFFCKDGASADALVAALEGIRR